VATLCLNCSSCIYATSTPSPIHRLYHRDQQPYSINFVSFLLSGLSDVLHFHILDLERTPHTAHNQISPPSIRVLNMNYLTFSLFPNRLTKPVISRFIPTRTQYRITSPRSAMVRQYRETTGLARNIGFFSTPTLTEGACCSQRFGQQRNKSHNMKQHAMGGTLFFPLNCIQQIRYSTQRRSYARLNNFLKVPFGPFRPPGPPRPRKSQGIQRPKRS
jgi:hypothetical protein